MYVVISTASDRHTWPFVTRADGRCLELDPGEAADLGSKPEAWLDDEPDSWPANLRPGTRADLPKPTRKASKSRTA